MLDQVIKQYKLRQVGINYYSGSMVHISILHSRAYLSKTHCSLPLRSFSKLIVRTTHWWGGGTLGNIFSKKWGSSPHTPSHPHTRLNHTYTIMTTYTLRFNSNESTYKFQYCHRDAQVRRLPFRNLLKLGSYK